MKRTVTVILSLILATVCCACADDSSTRQSAAEPKAQTFSMVTLGDSIAAGYGLETPEEQRYSALTAQQLTDETVIWQDHNYAVSGDTADRMLKRLENGRAVRLPSADVITISIGANHMLQPFAAFYGVWLSEDLQASSQTDRAFTEMETSIAEGLAAFETQLPLIYEHITDRNPDAQIILLTVYNPFADVEAEIALTDTAVSLADYADEMIGKCNAIIRSFAQQHEGVSVADIYTAFAEHETTPVIGQISGKTEYYMDPHPNAKGHEIIAEVIGDLITGETE